MFKVAIDYARDGMRCEYLEAQMVSPESKHLGDKFGFEVIYDMKFTNPEIAYALGAQDNWEVSYDLQGLNREQ